MAAVALTLGAFACNEVPVNDVEQAAPELAESSSPGNAAEPSEPSAPSEPSEPTMAQLPEGDTERLKVGRNVFAGTCYKCHLEGLGDAPVVLDAEAWKPRITQPIDTLYAHALEGFWGDVGEMPARGDNDDLSDEEVTSAVDYIVFVQRH